jgi:hypothetical protein
MLQTTMSPDNWTTPRLRAVRPPSAADAPTTPSAPTMATSTLSPDPSITTKDTTALAGKVDVLQFPSRFKQDRLLLERRDREIWLKAFEVCFPEIVE